uniref:HORMA domain-containing protein n=1 Tax=Loa loa TaxID=7209 RepID=A0A1I7VLT7_LOALO
MSEDGSEMKSYRKGREMKLFPSSLDSRSSTLFMKRFLFIIVSDIIKKRLLIPTSVFKDIVIDGLKCCIVTEDTELGKKLSALLYAVSEAIEKHYLRDFFILVSTEEADSMDEVIEAYTLTFTYADGGRLLLRSPLHEISLLCESVTELRKEVIALLHRLDVLMNVLSPVPQSAFPYFKLTYYASTPYNYEPTGFKSSSTTYRFRNMTFISKISAGTFSTKFESCSVCLESVFFGSANGQHEQRVSVDKNELQKITEDEDNGRQSMNLRISSSDAQMEATDDISQENTVEIIESMRASLLEENSPNEYAEAEKVILSYEKTVASTTDLQKSDFNPEYGGDSEEVPESSGQFATFGSPSAPYINSPRMDSTFSLPTVTERISREPIMKKDSSVRSPSSGISISAESTVTRELFMRRSSNVGISSNAESTVTRELFMRRSSNIGISSNAEPKAKKMKISRSKVDYHKVTEAIV